MAAAWLGVALVTVIAIVGLERLHVRAFAPYAIGAGVLWFAVFESGVHATIAGVVLGFLTPHRPFHPPEAVVDEAVSQLERLRENPPDGVADEDEQNALLFVSEVTTEAVSPLARLVQTLHPWSSYVVLPLFALANAGVALGDPSPGTLLSDPVTLGVVLGLVVGSRWASSPSPPCAWRRGACGCPRASAGWSWSAPRCWPAPSARSS